MTFKITKFEHSCLLVESDEGVALFDPGSMSQPYVDIDKLDKLDDIFITHAHGDHFDLELIQSLVNKFPEVRITTTPEVMEELQKHSIKASSEPPTGVTFFDSPHEDTSPMFPAVQEIGVHYLDSLSHPGDSHSFSETKQILALPVTAPWGSNIKSLKLAMELKPKHVLPIHDWHWRDEARVSTYDHMEKKLSEQGITFHKLVNGEPIEIDI
jgi:L-ascorbate metabolism protein UlaG (beta-lactamase superfamily)